MILANESPRTCKARVQGEAKIDNQAAAANVARTPLERLLDGTTIPVGCNNIVDEEPRFVAGASSATNLTIYDPYGRFVNVEMLK